MKVKIFNHYFDTSEERDSNILLWKILFEVEERDIVKEEKMLKGRGLEFFKKTYNVAYLLYSENTEKLYPRRLKNRYLKRLSSLGTYIGRTRTKDLLKHLDKVLLIA